MAPDGRPRREGRVRRAPGAAHLGRDKEGSVGGLPAATGQPPGTRGISPTRKDRAGQARAEGAGLPQDVTGQGRAEQGGPRGGPRGAVREPGTRHPHFPARVSPLPPRCSGSAITGAEGPRDAGGKVSVAGQGQPVLRRTEAWAGVWDWDPGCHARTQPASGWASWKVAGSASHLPRVKAQPGLPQPPGLFTAPARDRPLLPSRRTQ